MERSIYLDHAAATPVDERVIAAMEPYWQDKFYNPSALYTAARSVKSDLHKVRSKTASLLGIKSREVYFTAGATEANNIAIAGIMRRFQGYGIIISSTEHDAIRLPARNYANNQEVVVQSDGRIKPEDVIASVREDTVLISIEYANSEIGVIQPLQDIAEAVAGIRAKREKAGNKLPLYLHTDASQAVGYLNMQLPKLGVDMATINGGKIYGPKQSGILYVARGIELEPLLYGGGQERGFRVGTENVAFAAGIAQALEIAENLRPQESKRQKTLQKLLLDKLRDINSISVNGSLKNRLPGNVNMSISGIDGEMLVHHLDAQGIQAATGSACSVNDDMPSHVLKALGLDEEAINGSLRLSFGRSTTEDDIIYTADTLAERVQALNS